MPETPAMPANGTPGRFLVDLHLHSCLSPCGDLDMSPRRIAREARLRGLSAAALCDHNSALNCPAFEVACESEGILGIYGIEVTSREEVHLLCLFDSVDAALEMGDYLYRLLMSGAYDAARFGDQIYVNEDEVILGNVEKHLIGAVDLSLEEIGREAQRRGGLFIPAHIDRAVYSVSSQLGFLPEGNYDAVEIVRSSSTPMARGVPIVASSDAHFPGDIAARHSVVESTDLTLAGISRALSAGLVTPVFASPNLPDRECG
ncbi:MAG TPA: PHP domain-containing protein [Spirochaetia bacterium]|nr:PHP domain-containing protein [Spirochaetia bacterium]